MDAELQIKKAGVEDASVLEKISCDTFIETFASQNTKEDMDLFLKDAFNLEAITKELDNKDTAYYMAFIKDELAGYVKIRKATEKGLPTQNCLEIARIYVYKKFHNWKIGAALMKYVIEFAEKNGIETVWLGVWEHNPKAIEFYKRWGFEQFGEHVFLLGTDKQNDLLMCKKLKKE